MIKPQSEIRTPDVQRFGRSFCPKCSDMLLAPVMCEHVSESSIRHIWCCDSCGHEFHTTVRLPALSKRARTNLLS
jgi:RNase P subunit RPR2